MDERGGTPDMIVLDDADNVATALRTVPSGKTATVAGTGRDVQRVALLEEIALGHKAALVAIAPGELVVKHGHPIGRATAAIAAGAHVHVHNVISLSDETDGARLGGNPDG